jgi:hypothetical protein
LRDSEQHTKDKLERILNEWREERDEREVIVTGDDIAIPNHASGFNWDWAQFASLKT